MIVFILNISSQYIEMYILVLLQDVQGLIKKILKYVDIYKICMILFYCTGFVHDLSKNMYMIYGYENSDGNKLFYIHSYTQLSIKLIGKPCLK